MCANIQMCHNFSIGLNTSIPIFVPIFVYTFRFTEVSLEGAESQPRFFYDPCQPFSQGGGCKDVVVMYTL